MHIVTLNFIPEKNTTDGFSDDQNINFVNNAYSKLRKTKTRREKRTIFEYQKIDNNFEAILTTFGLITVV